MSPACEAYLESAWVRTRFCSGCPGLFRVPGVRGPLGEPLSPDEETCPSGDELGGDGCVRAEVFAWVLDALAAADAAVESAVSEE